MLEFRRTRLLTKTGMLPTFEYLLGGGMSSRLFQNIRERQGLAYAIYSDFRLIAIPAACRCMQEPRANRPAR